MREKNPNRVRPALQRWAASHVFGIRFNLVALALCLFGAWAAHRWDAHAILITLAWFAVASSAFGLFKDINRWSDARRRIAELDEPDPEQHEAQSD